MEHLRTGHPAPALCLLDQRGEPFDLAEHPRRDAAEYRRRDDARTVVYFFAGAFTPECTTQACDLRKNLAWLKGAGVGVVGVSGDAPDTLAEFDQRHGLPYPLLSDPDHAAARAWGAWGTRTVDGRTSDGPLRATFVVGPDRSLQALYYRVDPATHANWLMRELGL